ncbi:MAG: glycosyltransferase family 39 protein, partial [Anaerolineae bacterium]
AVCALAGHPQTLMHAAYLCAATYLFCAWHAGWSWRWILGGGALLGFAALGVSAGSWLPAMDYLPLTERAGVGYDFVRSGLPLIDYVQLLVPNALTLFAPQYAGLGAAIFAGLALCNQRRMPRRLRRETAFWLGAAVIAGVLALGDDGVLFAAGYRVLPGFSLFRQQERWLSVFSPALALLAALGVTAWLDEDLEALLPALRRTLWSVAALLLAAGIVLAVILRGTPGAWLPVWGRAWALAGLSAVLLVAPVRERWRRVQPVALAVLMLLLVVDLGIVNARTTPRVPAYGIPRDAWANMLRAAGEPTAAAPERVDTLGQLSANLGELYGIEDLWGTSPMRPEALVALLRALPRERQFALLDVGYLLIWGPLEDPALELVTRPEAGTLTLQKDALYLYRNLAPHARAWLAHYVLLVPDQAAALAAVTDPALDPLQTVVLEGQAPAAALSAGVAPSAGESVRVERVSASELAIVVDAATDGYLVISEWYMDGLLGNGWRATVDGAAASIRRADYALQAIVMPAGAHDVRFWYAAPALWAGAGISIVSLAIVALLAWFGRGTVPYRRGAAAARVPAPGGPLERDAGRSEGWPLPAGAVQWAVYIAGGLALLGLILRLYRLGIQELRGDEALSYLMALGSPREIVASLLAVGDPHSPLHYLLLHATIAAAGVSEFAMRLPSALLGVLAIPVAWGIGRFSGGARRGLLLATLAAVGQPLVWIGQDLRSQYVLAVLFYGLATLILLRLASAREPACGRHPIWALYAVCCALRIHRLANAILLREYRRSQGAPAAARPYGGCPWLWIAYALCAALSVYAFYYAALALLGHAAYVLCHAQRRRLLRPWLLGALLAAAFFSPWLVAGRESLLSSGQLSDPDAPQLAPFILESVTYL